MFDPWLPRTILKSLPDECWQPYTGSMGGDVLYRRKFQNRETHFSKYAEEPEKLFSETENPDISKLECIARVRVDNVKEGQYLFRTRSDLHILGRVVRKSDHCIELEY